VRVRWSARAADQLVDAVRYEEAERAGSGAALLGAVDDLTALLLSLPRLLPAVPGAEPPEVRRALLRRWGYWLVYDLRGDEIVVLALWHGRRSPGGWRPR